MNSLYFNLTDHQSEVTIADQPSSEDKVAKHVTFSEGEEHKEGSKPETIRNFYMMETSTEEGKPNFLMGGEDGFEDIEEKDEFPSTVNGGLTKQLSDVALIDKRRRLR